MENYMLKQIAEILKELNAELKLDNDKWEKAQNESTTILRSSNDGTTSTRITTTGEKSEL